MGTARRYRLSTTDGTPTGDGSGGQRFLDQVCEGSPGNVTLLYEDGPIHSSEIQS